jgi:hypothetical protein
MTTADFISGGGPRAAAAALLGLLLLAAWGCAKGDGLSDYEREQKKQENAAAAIQAAGGTVTTKHYDFGPGKSGDGKVVDLHGAQITDAVFDNFKLIRPVAELDLSGSTVTDDQLAKLNEPDAGTLLVRLDLSNTGISDAGLEKLTDLYVLLNLKLVGTKVTPAGVERFQQKRQENPKTFVKSVKVQLK